MELVSLVTTSEYLFSPTGVGFLVALAIFLMWMAFAPAQSIQQIQGRLDGYLASSEALEEAEFSQPFATRVIVPMFRWLLSTLGQWAPKRNLDRIQHMLYYAGEPFGMTALDFLGLRMLSGIAIGVLAVLLMSSGNPFPIALRNGLLLGGIGFFLPQFWLRRLVKSRQEAITRALPDALDMLTISVEAGLAFESALARVVEKWDNPLTQVFGRALAEIQVGTSRNVALKRMADRTGVEDLRMFVSVLIQSTQLGVSIAHVLHTQADEIRTKRRQAAEERARQASVKMVFPLVFLLFPALFTVILGPSIPTFLYWLERLGGN